MLTSFRVAARVASFLAAVVAGSEAADAPVDPPPSGAGAGVKIAVTSAQPSAGSGIRQRAFDGHDETAYRSAGPARGGDHLTLTFDRPAPVRGVGVVAAAPDGTEALGAGTVEVAEDGATFTPVATLDAQGRARAELAGRPVRAVRVRVDRDRDHPLVVREFAIESEPVRPFRHPVEIAVDCADAPELQTWTEETARLCEQWYDTLNAAISLTDTHPSDHFTIVMRRDYKGVAAADSRQNRITGSVQFFTAHPQDRGAMIHETVHIIQNYRRYGSRRAPSWLVEGMDDYIRFFLYEPGQAGPVRARQAHYDGSYRVTATFLDFVLRTYDPQLIPKLDQALRAGTYEPQFFADLTGKTLAELNNQWRASMNLPPEAEKAVGEPAPPAAANRRAESGQPFRDEPAGRLARITLGQGSWVDSIACTWGAADGEAKGATHGGTGGERREVVLEPGESLLKVSGVIHPIGPQGSRVGPDVVGGLTFQTNRRKVAFAGSEDEGREFSFEAPPGQEICGFEGRSGDYLNALGIVCRPIP